MDFKQTIPRIVYPTSVSAVIYAAMKPSNEVTGWRENFNLFRNVIFDSRWREFYLISAISRLVLCQLRDEIFENNSESKKVDHLVSNKSLIIYSILNFTTLFISSDVSMIFMSTTLGWELAGIFYKAIQKYYPV